MMLPMDRRGFLKSVAAASVTGYASVAAAAAPKKSTPAKADKKPAPPAEKPPAEKRPSPPTSRLPARGEFVIRSAYVMTMDAKLGDIAGGDVYVRNGEIFAVGRDLKGGGEVIDGRGMIVLPGFVDTHWHMWNTLLRSMAGDTRERGYFATSATLGKVFTPDDMYQGTRLAAAEAIANGITFVHDWCHNIRGPEHALADLRALKESGLRGRFSYGAPQGHPATETIDLDGLAALRGSWGSHASEGLLSLGLAWRGMGAGTATIPPEVYQREFEAARAAGIPISVHAANARSRAGQIGALAEGKFLGEDVQVIHAIWVTPDEIRALAESGASVSLSPYTELRIGFGFPRTGDLINAGVTVGLSVDTTTLSGNADMFAIMKVTQNVENSLSENEFKLAARRVLELATVGGARAMGIEDRVGSLRPGKRADLMVVSTRDVNMGVFTDPAHLLVEAAQPSNIDTVVVDGRILKRRGKLAALDPGQIVSEASAALTGVRKRAGW